MSDKVDYLFDLLEGADFGKAVPIWLCLIAFTLPILVLWLYFDRSIMIIKMLGYAYFALLIYTLYLVLVWAFKLFFNKWRLKNERS